ncbi:unnamed protein product [Linum tenue]|uniref:Uncharacterized protein n=1 Tax=Linum tenue TaxID=586396 RepID=A0AAV0QD24_9ROSI|nr:unnamed protein product [Linum tenue]
MLALFDRFSFVENVRETLKQKDGVGVISLQNSLISNLCEQTIGSVRNVSEGVRTIRDRISRFKVLIVLDDVDELFKFDEIFGNHENFAQGSRFTITSRTMCSNFAVTMC